MALVFRAHILGPFADVGNLVAQLRQVHHLLDIPQTLGPLRVILTGQRTRLVRIATRLEQTAQALLLLKAGLTAAIARSASIAILGCVVLLSQSLRWLTVTIRFSFTRTASLLRRCVLLRLLLLHPHAEIVACADPVAIVRKRMT